MFTKKHNSLPFVILFIIHLFLLVLTFYKKKNRTSLFMLLMSNIGISYLFEYVVLNIFHLYKYKPHIFRREQLDNVFGAILSQAIYIPFTAVFITAFKLGWIGKICFSFYFSIIEIIFKKLKVYKQQGWKTIYTFLFLTIFFFISDEWYKWITKRKEPILTFSLYFMTGVIGINVLFLLAVIGKIKFGIGRYFSWYEHFLLVPLYSLIHSGFLVFFIKKTRNWKEPFYSFVTAICFDTILKKINIMKFPSRIQVLFHCFIIGCTVFFKKLVYYSK